MNNYIFSLDEVLNLIKFAKTSELQSEGDILTQWKMHIEKDAWITDKNTCLNLIDFAKLNKEVDRKDVYDCFFQLKLGK